MDNYYNEDFKPTREQWETYSKEVKEEILLDTKRDLQDEQDFLTFYESKDNPVFAEQIIETENNIKRLNEKYEYLLNLGE